MNASETASFMKLLRTIGERGITILLVEHDMPMVMGVSDRIVVLNYGRIIAEGPPAEIQRIPTSSPPISGNARTDTGCTWPAPMLEIRNLVCRYGQIAAVKGVSLSVKDGQLVALIEANGAGKTTTLRSISGLLPAAGGQILFDGKDITRASAREILSLGIAHAPEGRKVFPQMTVEENLEMGAYLRTDARAIADDMARVFDQFPRLAERRAQVAGTLSGGEQHMLAIGRALMSRPKLVLFDEPSLGLAPNIVERTFAIIEEIRASGTTVLMVEQNAYAALDTCDYAYLLESGILALGGLGKQLIANPHVRAAYLGG
jgi:branched-chain amino acid transport system ATP-binding protein